MREKWLGFHSKINIFPKFWNLVPYDHIIPRTIKSSWQCKNFSWLLFNILIFKCVTYILFSLTRILNVFHPPPDFRKLIINLFTYFWNISAPPKVLKRIEHKTGMHHLIRPWITCQRNNLFNCHYGTKYNKYVIPATMM